MVDLKCIIAAIDDRGMQEVEADNLGYRIIIVIRSHLKNPFVEG
jgi:hypothetical protein